MKKAVEPIRDFFSVFFFASLGTEKYECMDIKKTRMGQGHYGTIEIVEYILEIMPGSGIGQGDMLNHCLPLDIK